MPRLIDISVRVHPAMPTWPGSAGVRFHADRSFERGDAVNVTRLDMDVHSGTHVEAPLHFIDGGPGIDTTSLEVFVGLAHVIDLGAVRAIGGSELQAASIPAGSERILIRTANSGLWSEHPHEFREDFAALTDEGAAWLVNSGIRLVGIDYLSVQLFGGNDETHRTLMRGGIAILEGLDLSGVAPGEYRLTCLPLRLSGTEAAPARAILEALQ